MAAQEHIPLISTVLGSIGTLCWTVQIIPQIVWVFRHRKTDQKLKFPALMYFLWALNAIISGVYAIVQNFNRALWAQAQIFAFLAMVCLFQSLWFQHRFSLIAAVVVTIVCSIFLGCSEGAIVYFLTVSIFTNLLKLTTKHANEQQSEVGIRVCGYASAILIGTGLLPPLYDNLVAKGQNVSLSWLFLCIDFAGAIFSLASLITQTTYDSLGGAPYIVCMSFHASFVILHLFWMATTRWKARYANRDRSWPQLGMSTHKFWIDNTPEPSVGFLTPLPGTRVPSPVHMAEMGIVEEEVSCKTREHITTAEAVDGRSPTSLFTPAHSIM